MPKQVPSLSATGWLSEISERADAVVAYYITSDYSQSYIFLGQIASLPYDISLYANDLFQLENQIHVSLGRLLRRYFDQVDLEVRTDIPSEFDPNQLNITIDAVITDQGYRYSLGREIKIANKRVVEVFKINNEGQ